MEIDPPKYGAYDKVGRGDADAERRAKDAAKSIKPEDDPVLEITGWARQVLSEKAATNKSSNQGSSIQSAANFGRIAPAPPTVTPVSPLSPNPQKAGRPQSPEIPGVDSASKYYSLHWVPGKGMTWIEVPDESLNYVLTYQAESEDGFVYEEITDC